MTEATEMDPDLQGFAALMAGAGQEAKGEPDPAPYGYTRDEQTGEMRPKKAPGRPRKSPSLEDLKARKEADPGSPEAPGNAAGDRPPAQLKGRKGRARPVREPRPAPAVPQSLRMEGSIAKGINQLYRRCGKLVRVMDRDIGQALIDITRAEDPEDVTVGDAWEQLCRSNPRIRAFWVRLLGTSAGATVIAAHLPVFAAILMKDAVRRRVPFWGLAQAMADDSEDSPAPSEGTVFEGLRPEDMAQMAAMAQAHFGEAMARGNGVPDRGEG